MRETNIVALGTVTRVSGVDVITDVQAIGGAAGAQIGTAVDLSLYNQFTVQVIISATNAAGGAVQVQESTDLANWTDIGAPTATFTAAGTAIIHGTQFGKWVRVVMADTGAAAASITGHVRIYAKMAA
tara:strand:- start:4242 stop:4625 length:384 start_codon:yes stop_codon:yes gene_type:complete